MTWKNLNCLKTSIGEILFDILRLRLYISMNIILQAKSIVQHSQRKVIVGKDDLMLILMISEAPQNTEIGRN
jgi:hypothetical protein